jgi:hypothetical protein
LIKYLKFGNQTIFSINNQRKLSFFQHNFENGYYYAKIGKKVDNSLNNFFYLLIILSLIISILIGFILTKTLKNLGHSNNKIIYLLICITSYLLIGSNIINAVYFLFFKNRKYCFTLEYTTLLIYSFYKSNIISILILVLLGWGTIFFYLGNTFKKLNKYLFLIDLVCSISIPLSVYFIDFTCKLNLFYIKNCIEYLLLFCINVFSIFKRVIPLANQMKYEQRIGSNQFNCIAFKYNKLILINIIIAIYTIFFIFTPFLDKAFMKYYVNNYNYYFIFQLLYETIFFIFFFIIFFPKQLPDYYFNDIVFKYKSQLFLVAYIYDGKEINNPSINDDDNDIDYSNKFNISHLTRQKIKQLSKKNKNPIIFMNPFASSINKKILKEIHISIISKT